MSEMVERAADAMMKADWGTERPMPPDAKIKNYYEMARAAIEAMREPTEAMIDAGNDSGNWGPGASMSTDELQDAGPRACWQAMIDAALK